MILDELEFSCIGAYNPSGVYPSRLVPLFARAFGTTNDETIFHQNVDGNRNIAAFDLIEGISRTDLQAVDLVVPGLNRGFRVGTAHLRAFALDPNNAIFGEWTDLSSEFYDELVSSVQSVRNPLSAREIIADLKNTGAFKDVDMGLMAFGAVAGIMAGMLGRSTSIATETGGIIPQEARRTKVMWKDNLVFEAVPVWLAGLWRNGDVNFLWQTMDEVCRGKRVRPVISKLISGVSAGSGFCVHQSANTSLTLFGVKDGHPCSLTEIGFSRDYRTAGIVKTEVKGPSGRKLIDALSFTSLEKALSFAFDSL